MDLIQLSQTIRKIRLAQNMTIEQLAQKSGFSKGFISQVENFRITPSLKALIRIAEALGIPVKFTCCHASLEPELRGRVEGLFPIDIQKIYYQLEA